MELAVISQKSPSLCVKSCSASASQSPVAAQRSQHEIAVWERLQEARKLGQHNKWRMRGPPLVLGFPLCLVGIPMILGFSNPRMVNHDANSVAVARLLSSLCLVFAIVSLQLAALPTDSRIVRLLTLMWSVAGCVAFVQLLFGMSDFYNATIELDKLRIFINLPAMFLSASVPVRVCFTIMSAGTRSRLFLVWRITAEVGLVAGFVNILHGCLSAVLWRLGYDEGITVTRCAANIGSGLPWLCVGAYLCFDENLPRRVHARLSAADDAIVAASGIASVVGDHDPDFIISVAIRLCKSVSLDKVLKDDFSSNKPAAEGHGCDQYTEDTPFGDIDAFISHSWHDNADAKWAALQAWRESFKAQNEGREPRVWIDKYCIDQSDIATGLMCLPVFLAASQQLVILYGDTYLERLWCVMELLVFLYMGGSVKDMHMRKLTTNPRQSQKWDSLIGAFSTDAAKCTRPQDRDTMLGCIEAGFGGKDRFESLVRGVMAKLARRQSSSLIVP